MRRATIGGVFVALLFLIAPAFAGESSRVVVRFKGAPDGKLLERLGGRGVESLPESGCVVVSLPAGKISGLRREAGVAWVEEDGIATASRKSGGSGGSSTPAETVPWGVAKVWGGASGPANTGSGVKVAIIDTGIDLDHPDLAANVDSKGSVDFTGARAGPDDDNGHGSHVAGTVAAVDNDRGYVGVAPGATLYAVKVLDRRGSGWLSDVAKGIAWTGTHGINVANMSLGASSGSTALSDACDAAVANGVLLVAAAGNSGDGKISTTETSYPAAYASVVAVGATDSKDNLASFSNTGSYVEVSAPGVSIPSTYKGGGYAKLSGTSMASPHAAGLAALIWNESESSTPASVRAELVKRVRDAGSDGYDNGYGNGIVYYPK